MNYLKNALEYHDQGFRVIPTGENKGPLKSSLLARHKYGWTIYQTEQSKQDVIDLFTPDSEGIAVLTGIDGLECIDIDNKYSLNGDMLPMLSDEIDSLKAGICIPDTVIVKTKSGGFHVLYRCDSPGTNTKLSSRPATEEEKLVEDKVKVLFETRGVGGYIVAWPTTGYEMYHGLMSGIPRVKMAHRDTLIRAARLFNEVEEPVQMAPQERSVAKTYEQNGKSTIDDYNTKGDVPLMLSQAGWKFVKQTGPRHLFKRPGNTDAATSADWHEGFNIFKCWSTSTEFKAEKGYSPFGVYAVLNHKGDWSAAAKALYEKGFGDRLTVAREPATAKTPVNAIKSNDSFDDDFENEIDPDAELDALLAAREFDVDAEPQNVPYTLRCEVDDEWHDVGGPGDIGLITGLAKSRKSTFLCALMASALDDGRKKINFQFKPGGTVVFFDTEQGKRSFWKMHKKAMMMARQTEKPPTYRAFSLRGLVAEKKLAAIERAIAKIPNMACMVIDSVLDLSDDYNDTKQSQASTLRVMDWAENANILLFCVIHQGKGTGFTLGHLGSMLDRRCSFSIEMKYDEKDGSTLVTSKLSRDTPRFPPFSFYQDKHGFPVLNYNESYVVKDGIAVSKMEHDIDEMLNRPTNGHSTDSHGPEPDDPYEAPAQVLTEPVKFDPANTDIF